MGDKITALFNTTPSQLGHTDFVSALAYTPPSPSNPDGLVVSGARDATVRLWNPVRFIELQILEGHKYQVGWGPWQCGQDCWAPTRHSACNSQQLSWPLYRVNSSSLPDYTLARCS